jgi:hypothetical protein
MDTPHRQSGKKTNSSPVPVRADDSVNRACMIGSAPGQIAPRQAQRCNLDAPRHVHDPPALAVPLPAWSSPIVMFINGKVGGTVSPGARLHSL